MPGMGREWAGNGLDDGVGPGPVGTVLNAAGDLLVEAGFGLTPHKADIPGLQPVLQPRLVLDQGLACDLQLLENRQVFRLRLIRNEIKRLSHACQHGGIDGIGLCQCSTSLGKAPGLERVDLHQRKPARERSLERAVPGTGGLIDHAGGHRFADPSAQGSEPCCGIGQLHRASIAQPVDVKKVF